MTFKFTCKILIPCIIAVSVTLISNFLGDWFIPADGYQNRNRENPNQKIAETAKMKKKGTIGSKSSRAFSNGDRGKNIAKKCITCHSLESGGRNKVGPNLYNVINRNRGAVLNYNYSKAMKKMRGRWEVLELYKYIKNPNKFMPGTKMSFKGIKRREDRISLILYLNQFSENPINLSNELGEE